MQLVHLLLDHGASAGYKLSRSLFKAAELAKHETVQLLLAKVPGKSRTTLSTSVFEKTFNNGNFGQTESNYLTMKHLLQAGACGEILNKMLIQAVINYEDNAWCRKLVTVLMSSGADVSWKDGTPLRLATQSGSSELVDFLLQHTPSTQTVCLAIRSIFEPDEPADASAIVRVLDTFRTRALPSSLNFDETGSQLPLMTALERYAHPREILDRLFAFGSDVNQSLSYSMTSNEDPEEVPLLCWAICHGHIGDLTLCFLINRGGKP